MRILCAFVRPSLVGRWSVCPEASPKSRHRRGSTNIPFHLQLNMFFDKLPVPSHFTVLDKFGASVLIYLLICSVASMESKARKREYSIQVKQEWCKGCTICVEFCPEEVLAMDGNKVKVVNPQACKGCTLCELMCPDFAITVVRNGGK